MTYLNYTVYVIIDWLQSFLFYIYFSLSLHYFFIMILFNPTSSYLWLNTSQGTEVNKNSTSYTSVVSPQKKKKKKKKKKKEKKNKERVWGQTNVIKPSNTIYNLVVMFPALFTQTEVRTLQVIIILPIQSV